MVRSATPLSRPVAVFAGQAQRAVLGLANERQNLRNRRIFSCQMLHAVETLGKHPGTVEQLLIERAHGGKPLARTLSALQADDVEALETGVLAAAAAERNHIPALTAEASHHHLGPEPRALVHHRRAARDHETL